MHEPQPQQDDRYGQDDRAHGLAGGSTARAKFKDEHRRATSIQNTVQSDSIIALSQRSEEFCNTIALKADTASLSRRIRQVPNLNELSRRVFRPLGRKDVKIEHRFIA
jgi:hypothetical protein